MLARARAANPHRTTVQGLQATPQTRALVPAQRLLPHAILVLLAGLSVASWGDLSTFLAQGDLFPFTLVNPTRWIVAGTNLWQSNLTVGGDLSYASGYFLASLLEWGPTALGVPAALLQRLECGVLLAGTLLAVYGLFAELGITSRVVPRFIGSVAYGFSLALLVQASDLVFSVVCLTAVLLPLLYARYLRASPRAAVAYGVAFVLTSQLAAYLFINPPQLVVVTVQSLLVGLLILRRQRGKHGVVGRTLLLVCATLGAGSWWVVPAYVTTFNPAVGITAVTNVEDWSFTQVRASLLHDWRFTSSWGWILPQYYPWATFYAPRPVQIVQLWPLAVASLALLLSRRRLPSNANAVLGWCAAAVVAVFLIKGVHPPLDGVNLWIYQHVPGFFLFREPTTKFSEPLDFVIAVLLVMLLAQLGHIWARRPSLVAAVSIGAFLVVGTLAIPAFTGMVVEDAAPNSDMGDAHKHVAVPDYWYQMASFLHQQPDDGGYVLLPNDDQQYQLYDWGLYGVDALPLTLLPRPAWYLYDSPQGYSSASQDLDRFGEQVVAELRNRDTTDLARQLGLFGVRYILVRHDIATDTLPQRLSIPPEQITALLKVTGDVTLTRQVGALDLYTVAPSLVRPGVFAVPAAQTAVSQVAGLATVTANATVGLTTVSTPTPSCSASAPTDARAPVHADVVSQRADSYTVRVSAEHAPVLLVLNQSFNPDWQATAIQSSATSACGGSGLPHVMANGFANAWWITQPGTTEVRLTFTPQRAAHVADTLSVVVLAVCALLAVVAALLIPMRRLCQARGHGADS